MALKHVTIAFQSKNKLFIKELSLIIVHSGDGPIENEELGSGEEEGSGAFQQITDSQDYE